MPAKRVKIGGRWVTIKAVRLPNGNLLIPSRMEQDRTQAFWKEVTPGTSDYKRYSTVIVDEPDPRESPEYKARLKEYEQ